MSAVKVSAYYPNHSADNFGLLDEEESLAKFDEFPWTDLVRTARELEANGNECVDADLTFLADKVHFTARIRDDALSFDVEVAVVRRSIFFGISIGPKFFEIIDLPSGITRESLKVFLTESSEFQRAYFEQLCNAKSKSR